MVVEKVVSIDEIDMTMKANGSKYKDVVLIVATGNCVKTINIHRIMICIDWVAFTRYVGEESNKVVSIDEIDMTMKANGSKYKDVVLIVATGNCVKTINIHRVRAISEI
ncbi:hypothetical protein GOBAR_AA19164 [Gossypium barbadense]|uniref:Uncharacterized protein n=1 Tax=Gossypium barbadense TaxID=3634 RepID=A0A2P5XDS0_GOSBA|nr:hypothetical protein GOBAR_AA19164 [Gossypium barbadense]